MNSSPVRDNGHVGAAKAAPLVPPHDLEAEASVLAALLLPGSPIAEIRACVGIEEFYRPAHQNTFGAICALDDRAEPIDRLTVDAEQRRQRLDGLDIVEMIELPEAPLPRQAVAHARIVHECAVSRLALAGSTELAVAAHAGRLLEDLPGILERLADLGKGRSADKLAVRWAADAVLTPPLEPETLVEGMLRRGELAILGGPRAFGKSWFAANLAVLGARGEGLLGGTLRIARPFRSLIAQGEVDTWEAWRRWAMLTGECKFPDGIGETFDRWRLRVVRKRRASGGGADGSGWSESDEWIDAILDGRLEQTIAEYQFDVLVIDPWAVYFAGAENSNDETEAALDKLRDLAMRYSVAILILHHLGKATDVREPEDLWRGASRLADWASTRITLLPHWNEKQAGDQGMTRHQARRYVDLKFLRRSTPTEDFSMVLDSATGWWSRWTAPTDAAADARRTHLDVPDVVNACRMAGGTWPSKKRAAEALGVSQQTAGNLLARAVRQGVIETAAGRRRATIYRLPGMRPALGSSTV